jgi:hypothetical protein
VDRVLGVAIVLGILVIVFVALGFGWRARRRLQRDYPPISAPPTDAGTVRLRDDVLYVGTTRADAPLDRVAVRGLGFRARAMVIVSDSGVQLDIAGQPPAFLPAADLRGAGRATWTIDRVVNRDGLVFVRWRLGDAEIDSYLRSGDPAALVAAIDAISNPSKEEHP